MVRRSATRRWKSDARKEGKHTSATEKKNAKVTEEREKREEGAGAFYMQPGSSGETKRSSRQIEHASERNITW
jgi:hypothetical protein